MSAIGWTEVLVILIVGILLIVSVSSLIRRGRKQMRPRSPHRTSKRSPTINAPVHQRLPPAFADVEHRVEVLRQQVADGLLSEEGGKAQMRDLMVEDANGNWWMVGYETGTWYRHDGTGWVRADPPLVRDAE